MSEVATRSPARSGLIETATAAWPAVLYGVRLASGVCLALFAAFYLQLDNPSWAGTSAAIVAQPILGASLRKGAFRLLGTVIGATAIVVLTAVFPQDRLAFLLCVALWCAACSFVSTVLRNFAAYAAMLAGYTLVIIASSSIPAPDQVFTLAVARASEIALGIVCGMSVMAISDIGRSGGRLAGAMAAITKEILAGLRRDLEQAGGPPHDSRPERRALVARVIALDPVMDQAVGESVGVSSRRGTLRAGVNGLLLALSAWRTISAHLHTLDPAQAGTLGTTLEAALPTEGVPAVIPSDGVPAAIPIDGVAASGPAAERDRWFAAARAAREAPATTASARLGFDRIASVLDGLGRAANGIALLDDPAQSLPFPGGVPLFMPDILPPLVNAARVFVAVAAALLFVVATSWSTGYTFLTFLAVTVLLLSPQNEAASRAVIGFGGGTLLAALLAAVVKFAVLPNHEGYGSFISIIALVLVPVAALSTRPSLAGFLVPASMNFIPLLGPTNVIDYDTIAFANSALAIVGGCAAGAIALRVMPPVPAARRTQRLLALTLADLRRAMRRPGRLSPATWRRRVYGRLFALPATSDHVDGSRLLAALTVALQMIALRAATGTAGRPASALASVEHAIGRGAVAEARAALDAFAGPPSASSSTETLRRDAAIREVAETLAFHADYFGAAIR